VLVGGEYGRGGVVQEAGERGKGEAWSGSEEEFEREEGGDGSEVNGMRR
jgi:hypothetical protein